MPGAAQYQRMAPIIGQVNQQINAARVTGIVWAADGRGLDYAVGGKRFHFDFATKQAVEVPSTAASLGGGRSALPPSSGGPPTADCSANRDRGRQFESALSPDGT